MTLAKVLRIITEHRKNDTEEKFISFFVDNGFINLLEVIEKHKRKWYEELDEEDFEKLVVK